MDWLEQELKRALARKEPSLAFAARIRRSAARAFAYRWLAVAASVAVMAGAGVGYRRHQGIQAKERVMMAMRIAGGKLNQVQTHLREVGR